MSVELKEMIRRSPTLFTQSRAFRIFIEPFIHLLRTHPETIRIDMSSEQKYLYNFSIESFLLSQGLSLEDLYVIMRMNNLEDTHRIDHSIHSLLLPNPTVLGEYKSFYLNKLKK